MIGTYEDEWEMWWYRKAIVKEKLLRKHFVVVGLKLNSDNKLPAAKIAKLKYLIFAHFFPKSLPFFCRKKILNLFFSCNFHIVIT